MSDEPHQRTVRQLQRPLSVEVRVSGAGLIIKKGSSAEERS